MGAGRLYCVGSRCVLVSVDDRTCYCGYVDIVADFGNHHQTRITISTLFAQGPVSYKALAIRGRWNGTSICVDKATDKACKDEKIVYDFDTVKAGAGMIVQNAFKYVGKDLEPMGDLSISYNDSSHSWTAEYAGRTRIRWTYYIEKGRLRGTCVELPSHRLIRRVEAVRDPENPAK